LDDRSGDLVSAGGGMVDGDRRGCSRKGFEGRRRVGGDRVAGLPGEGGARDQGLEAAPLATGAAGAVRLDDDMADLAGEALRAAGQRAVEHATGRDAGADREVREVVDGPDDAAPMETEGRGPDVVLDDGRAAEPVLQLRPERQVGPAEVDREGHGA